MNEKSGLALANGEESRAGFALVAVLWFLVVVAAIVTPFAVGAKTELLLQSNRRQKLQLDLLAGVVAEQLAGRLLGGLTADWVDASRSLQSFGWCATRTHQFGYAVQAQSGLVDLNAAQPAELAVGLRALGFTPSSAAELADELVRFRSYAPHARSDRGRDVVTGGYKHAPFESVAELSDFHALEDYFLEDFRRAFTVHSKRASPDASQAPARLRQALQIDSSTEQQASTRSILAPAYAIEIASRRYGSPVIGYSGFIFVGAPGDQNSARPVETLMRDDIAFPEHGAAETCRGLMDESLVSLINEAAS